MKESILIAYYSWHGNTQKIAQLIQEVTQGTLFEIKPSQAYTTNYKEAVAQAKQEIEAGFKPQLASLTDITPFTTVFLGTPIWWHTMAPPLYSFITQLDFANKTIVPFYTHGGGGPGRYAQDIAQACPHSSLTEIFGVYESGGSETVSSIKNWLQSLKII